MMKFLTIFGKSSAARRDHSISPKTPSPSTSIVIACVCLLQASAQAQGPIVCEQLNRQCLLEQARLGRQDAITRYINRDCQRRIPGWRKISRCQLERAACESECAQAIYRAVRIQPYLFSIFTVTLAGCSAITCEQVNRIVRR